MKVQSVQQSQEDINMKEKVVFSLFRRTGYHLQSFRWLKEHLVMKSSAAALTAVRAAN